VERATFSASDFDEFESIYSRLAVDQLFRTKWISAQFTTSTRSALACNTRNQLAAKKTRVANVHTSRIGSGRKSMKDSKSVRSGV
jgi:hypothetical protein